MTILQTIILGIVEGLTEFLPISSTGHQILASYLLAIPTTEFLKSFEIIIQVGAIAAVLVVYWRKFLDFEILKKLFVAFLPTAIIGLALYSFVKKYLLGNATVVLWALAIGGVLIIVFEVLLKRSRSAVHEASLSSDVKDIGYGKAVAIGLFQAIAIIPGVSRSAATIIGGLWMDIKRTTIVEFSFLLAVPTLGAATALDIVKSYKTFSSANIELLAIGFITAFIVALLSIKFLLRFIRTYSFISFGVYRIILAVLFYIILF